MKVVFFGTPDFAVACLKALVESGQSICAVVTAPDKPAGRGLKLQFSAVKKYALEHHLEVLQPEKLKEPVFIEKLKSYQAEVQVVVAFRMLPEVVWNMPKYGTINLHASLLPQYRGAAPINWAIINGEKITGVTTFRLQHAIDTGGVLLQEQVAIQPDETAGTLHDKLMNIGAILMVKTIEGIEAGTLTEHPQKNLPALKSAPKLFTETAQIDWNQSAEKILNLIKGLSPYPGAFSQLNGKKMKVFSAQMEIEKHSVEIGSTQTDHKTYLKYACVDGFISILEMQLEGKTRMKIADYLRGNKVH